MKKYIINGKEITCKTVEPHNELREMLIDAMLEGWKVEIVDE